MSKLKVDEIRQSTRSVSDSANITLANDGNVTIPNTLNVTGDIKNSGLEYLSARWPLANDDSWAGRDNLHATDTSYIVHQKNVLGWTYSTSGGNTSIFTITGITAGIWYFHATYGYDRTAYTSGDKTIYLRMKEDSTDIWEGIETYEPQHHTSQSFSIIRNYSSVPSAIKIEFHSINTNYFRRLGNSITIYRLG